MWEKNSSAPDQHLICISSPTTFQPTFVDFVILYLCPRRHSLCLITYVHFLFVALLWWSCDSSVWWHSSGVLYHLRTGQLCTVMVIIWYQQHLSFWNVSAGANKACGVFSSSPSASTAVRSARSLRMKSRFWGPTQRSVASLLQSLLMIGLIYIVLGHWILGWSVDDARVRGGVTVWSVCVCVRACIRVWVRAYI